MPAIDNPPPACSVEADVIIATPLEICQAVHQVLMEYFEFVPIGGPIGVAFAPDEADSVGLNVVRLLEQRKGLSSPSSSEMPQSSC